MNIFSKVMSLHFNMLSRLAIAFLPRSKRLLISWIQSPSEVILEHMKIVCQRRSQDGRGLGQADHFLPYKFIGRTIECRSNFTKQLLIAS